MKRQLAAALTSLLALSAGAAEAQSCRVALILALDVSSSVDPDEYRLQLEGIAQALSDPAVRAAIFEVRGSSVALQVLEWSGIREQAIVHDWTEVKTDMDLDRMATVLAQHQRQFARGQTALGEALDFARVEMQRAPECWSRKIDVSGDGQSNVGIKPQDLYWEQEFGDIMVNGLAIEAGFAALSRYYQEFVIHGRDSFVITATSFTDFGRAIREKLIRELGVPEIGLLDGR